MSGCDKNRRAGKEWLVSEHFQRSDANMSRYPLGNAAVDVTARRRVQLQQEGPPAERSIDLMPREYESYKLQKSLGSVIHSYRISKHNSLLWNLDP